MVAQVFSGEQMKYFIIACLLFVAGESPRAQTDQLKRAFLESVTHRAYGPNFAVLATKIKLGEDTVLAYKQLDTLLAEPKGDMFWMYGCAGFYLATQDVLQAQYKQKIRECWKRFTPYRGDTENHFLMHYGSLLLMSEVWPDLDSNEWFTGQSSKEIHAQAKDYLEHWIDETVREGQIEWDSPRYAYYFITPLILLTEHEQSDVLRRKFKMMLEVEIADYAIEYLDGNYCGAHSRISDQAAIDPRSAEVTAYGEYFFGDSVKHFQPDLAFAALSSFTLPKIIRDIATERKEPFISTEIKRGRTTIRGTTIRNQPVYKTTSMTSEYALGSMQGGIVQPIQQQSWSFVFKSALPNNIIFSLHPNVSADELGMFFPEESGFMLERIGAIKAGYPSENKWVGGSPYEHIAQTEHQVVAHYEIARDAKFHHVDLFISKNADVSVLDRGDHSTSSTVWIALLCKTTFVGINVPSGAIWTDEGSHYRVRINRDTSSVWLVALDAQHRDPMVLASALSKSAPASVFGTTEFKEPYFNEKISIPKGSAKPELFVDTSMLYRSSFITSKLGSGVIQLHTHKSKLILDFNEVREY
jgi:hypothetical protein